jgi:hypothetical protein
MSAYNQENNTDNTILRYVIVSTLAELKNKIFYYNKIDEDTLQKVSVPFYYSVTGNERFLMDSFVYDSILEDKAVGNYETVPRGVLKLNSLAVNASLQTNKFVRGEFVRESHGVLKTFIVNTSFLPIDLTFEVTVVCSSNMEMLKVTESILSKLYKAITFSVDLGMFRVQAIMSVPEDFSQEKIFDFGLNDKKEFNVTFNIDVQSFIPVFENGVLLSEIDELVSKSTFGEENAGVGMIRSNSAGELGIQFGGVFQKFEHTIDDIRKSQIEAAVSNKGYVNPDSIQTGGEYSSTTIDSSKIQPESKESKEYRNSENT